MTVTHLDSTEAILRALRRTRTPAARGASNDYELAYDSPQGRRFGVREFCDSDTPFFAEEMIPNGRIAELNDQGHLIGSHADDRIAALKQDPNGFQAGLRASDIDPDTVIYSGSGLGVTSIYYLSLEDAAAAIADAIARNVWLASDDPSLLNDPEFQREIAQSEARMRAEHAEWQTSMRVAAQAQPGLFQGLYNFHGPLDREARTAILAYLNDPTEANWEAIHSMMITASQTVWQAWSSVDPNAPVSNPTDAPWSRMPDPQTLRQALRKAAGES